MTGFGKGEAENSQGRVCIEIKSLNHKYFDMISKLPPGFLSFEDDIKSVAQKHIKRGRLNLFLDYEDLSGKNSSANVNIKAAKRHVKLLRNMKTSLKLSGDVTVQQVMNMPGVITYRQQKTNTRQVHTLIRKALSDATKQLLASRQEEGKMLKKHLFGLCDKIAKSLKIIKQCEQERKKRYVNKLAKKIKNITGSRKIYDKQKLEEEAAIFIRNADIAEELCRVDAHLRAFKNAATNHKEVGRRLDFIAQELSREANTIGAKANNIRIAKEVIKTKSLIEKIREQTQNVE